MGIIISNTDFIGRWKIAQSGETTKDLNEFISKYEQFYLVQLLGKELFDLFAADLIDKVPQTQRFIDIFEEFYRDEESCVYHSQGMKAMVLGFVYFHYVRAQRIANTTQGNVISMVETSENHSSFSGLVSRFNESVDTLNAIQWFIQDNESDYSEENMQFVEYTSGI